MKRGEVSTLEEKKRVINQIQEWVDGGMGRLAAYHKAGMSDVTYYAWRKEIARQNGYPLVDGPKAEPVTGLQFTVVDGDEARKWVNASHASRFDDLKQSLLTRLSELRKSEALSFPVPNPKDKKEIQNIMTACKRALMLAGMPWKMRYSSFKGAIVVLHESKFPKSENGDKQ